MGDCVERDFDAETLFDDGDAHVNADSDSDLRFHSVLAGAEKCAEKCFDAQVLFDPFEK